MKVKTLLLIIVVILLLVGMYVVGNYFIYDKLISGTCKKDTQNCCDSWAEDNNIRVPACNGEWVIRENRCIYKCVINV